MLFSLESAVLTPLLWVRDDEDGAGAARGRPSRIESTHRNH